MRRPACLTLLLLAAVALAGCRTASAPPDYARPLPPGAKALRPVPEAWRGPIFATVADQLDDADFVTALGRSYDWFRIASAKTHFPVEGVTYDRARATIDALWELAQNPDAATRESELHRRFNAYESVGYNGEGILLYTGYFSPQFTASRTRQGPFQFPLYQRPDDLRSDPATGQILGREHPRTGAIGPYPARAEIEGGALLAGQELVWLPSRLDAFTIEVNGSAKLNLTDGSEMLVGYAGTNGREYTSIGRRLVADGVLDKNTVSMPTIRKHFRERPDRLDHYIRQNDRFVFFREYAGSDWPAGSLGFRVQDGRSLATDKKIFPRGGVVLASTELADGSTFRRLMLDQDTGGAIRAPGRADLYFGIGDAAERKAGSQAAEGRLFYVFLLPE